MWFRFRLLSEANLGASRQFPPTSLPMITGYAIGSVSAVSICATRETRHYSDTITASRTTPHTTTDGCCHLYSVDFTSTIIADNRHFSTGTIEESQVYLPFSPRTSFVLTHILRRSAALQPLAQTPVICTREPNLVQPYALPTLTIVASRTCRGAKEWNCVDVPWNARCPCPHLRILEQVVWQRFLPSRGRTLQRTAPHTTPHRPQLFPTARGNRRALSLPRRRQVRDKYVGKYVRVFEKRV